MIAERSRVCLLYTVWMCRPSVCFYEPRTLPSLSFYSSPCSLSAFTLH